MSQHGGQHGGDRRPWLIISKKEAEAIYPLLSAAVKDMNEFPALDNAALRRAERVIRLQLQYIEGGSGYEPDVTQTVIREMRS
jgi:hypothetical protein